jgi:membrane fusion protein, heavy metal efflux system
MYLSKIYSMMVLLGLVAFIVSGCSDTRTPEVKSNSIPEQSKPKKAIHAHNDASETCFICDETKRDSDRLWCRGHGRYEDRCFECHTDIQDKDRPYCTEHYLYEDECFLCDPTLAKAATLESPDSHVDVSMTVLKNLDGPTSAELSDRSEGLFCNEHGVFENECGICHPDLVGKKPVGEGMKVRFSSPESAKKAGVETGHAKQGTVNIGESTLGRLSFNMNNLALVSPYADGVIRKVYVESGQVVKKGDLLAELNSPSVADAKSALIKALVSEKQANLAFKRESYLLENKVATKQDYENAQAKHSTSLSEVERSRQQLQNIGLTKEEIKQVEKTQSASSILPLRAPFDGSVVDRHAVLGATGEMGTPLFQVADLSTMWLELSVSESHAVQLQTGSEVQAKFEAFPNETFTGELIWISSQIDESTRMVNARVLMPNTDKRLKSGLFGRALIAENKEQSSLTVPSDAIQTIDGQTIIFAKLEEDLYEARVVKTGPVHEGKTSVMQGILQEDEIALSESYILKSELLKGKLGVGCVDD